MEDDETYNDLESDFDLLFDIGSSSILDLLSGNAPSLLETSDMIRSQWDKLQKSTGQIKAKINNDSKEFLKAKTERILEKLKERKSVLLRDKFSFVLGVTYIWVTSFIISGAPNLMPFYYFITILPLITVRWFLYKSKKWHYFLADLCYFVNLLLVLFLFFFPNSAVLFSIVWILSNGPVAMAIYAWRNALVFHSLDKMTSIAIHIMPLLTTFCVRWLSFEESNSYMPSYPLFASKTASSIDIGIVMPILYSIAAYLFWQIVYYYYIFVRKAENVYSGSHATSFTFLLADYMKHKNDSFLLGLFKKTSPKYQPFLFMLLNLGYAVATIIPMVLMYRYYYLHVTYVLTMTMVSIFNGADYYMEVFSRKYRLELEELENVQMGLASSSLTKQVEEPFNIKKEK